MSSVTDQRAAARHSAATTRRTLLRRAAAGGLLFALPGAAGAQEGAQWIVLPRIQPVEEYRSQVLFVGDPEELGEGENVPAQQAPGDVPDVDPGEVPVGECDTDLWPAERTTEFDVYFVDRHSEEPASYDVPAYADEQGEGLEEGEYYITHQVVQCDDDYVTTQVEAIPEGESPRMDPEDADDPENGQQPETPDETGTDQQETPETETTQAPGFGVVAGLVGAAGAVALRLLRGRRDD